MSISGIGKSLETALFGSKKRVINTILTTVILFAVPITLQLTFQRQDVRQRASPSGADPGCPNDPNVNGVTHINATVCSSSPCEVGNSYTVPGGQQAKYYYPGAHANQDCIDAGLGAFCCSTINPATLGGGGGGGGTPDLAIYIISTNKQVYSAGENATVNIYVKNANGGAPWSGTVSGKYYANTAEGTNHVSQCMAIGSSPYGATCDASNIKSFSSSVSIPAGGYAQLTGVPQFTVQNAPGGAWMVYAYINIPGSGSVTESDATTDSYSSYGGNNMSGSSYGVNATVSTRCDTSPYCSGQCTPNSPNACSSNSGTQGNCVFTQKIGGGSCNTYQAPNQSCTPNCITGTCGGGGTPGVCGTGGGTLPPCTTQTYGTCTPNTPNACSANSGTQTCTTTGTACTSGTCASRPCTPTCTSGTCGGGGTPGVCGTTQPPSACTPTTCAAQGKSCGTISDNCGGTLTCGAACPSATPTCNGTIVCSGQCTAPANTCSNNNGTKSSCKYTTYNGSSNCTQANAADQQCTASNCTSPNVCTNGACVTPTPTNTPTPTSSPTPAAGTANIAISVTLPGIGTESYNNNAPRAARAVTVGLYQAGGNQKMKDATGNLSYQNGKYTGTVSITNITPGSYYVKVRLNNTQYKKNAASNITAGANSITFSANLVSGDIFSTNSLGLQEYNALVNCYNGGECSADTRTKADLNDDGSVDAKDINIVLVEFARGYTTGD